MQSLALNSPTTRIKSLTEIRLHLVFFFEWSGLTKKIVTLKTQLFIFLTRNLASLSAFSLTFWVGIPLSYK